jgi:glycosyltransferase involved in cell wall biosynthesis
VPELSVVVACRDRAALLAASLPHLTSALRVGDELVVVDAASTSDEVATVAARAGATVVRCETGGASAARNAGWRAARHDLVAFTDDDCRPAIGWANEVAHALTQLDAVCGRVIAEGDGYLSVLEDRVARDYAPGGDPALLGHGANLAVRRAALHAVGGWDERLGPGTRWPGAEDKDLLLRLLAAGHSAGYRPDPVVRHVQWRTRTQALRTELGYGRGLGALSTTGRGPTTGMWALRSAQITAADAKAGFRYGVAAGLLRTAGILWGGATARRGLR